jgi:serine/threonine protein phosphatase 1
MTLQVKTMPRPAGWLGRLLGRTPAHNPRIPQGRRVYAVGDVHGRHDLLQSLIGQVLSHADQAPDAQKVLLFVGDYVDRGKASKEVIDFLLKFDVPGWQKIFLRGNHDQAVLDFLDDPKFYRVWKGYGAQETLFSYGVMPPRFDDDCAFARARDEFVLKCPATHLEFLKNLHYTHIEGDYLFVHAGIRPGIALENQTPEDLLWIREDFLFSRQPLGKLVVHGHTPGKTPVRRKNRICIDTGAYATGHLTAVILEDDRCGFLTTSERTNA